VISARYIVEAETPKSTFRTMKRLLWIGGGLWWTKHDVGKSGGRERGQLGHVFFYYKRPESHGGQYRTAAQGDDLWHVRDVYGVPREEYAQQGYPTEEEAKQALVQVLLRHGMIKADQLPEAESPKKILRQALANPRKAPDESMHELRTMFAGQSVSRASIDPIDRNLDLWRLYLQMPDGKSFTSGPLTSKDVQFMAAEWNIFYFTEWYLANFEMGLTAAWYRHNVNLWGLLAGFQGEARSVIEGETPKGFLRQTPEMADIHGYVLAQIDSLPERTQANLTAWYLQADLVMANILRALEMRFGLPAPDGMKGLYMSWLGGDSETAEAAKAMVDDFVYYATEE